GTTRVVPSAMRVVDLMHENICRGAISSKRDLYYRDVGLFRSQLAVDNIVEDVACTLEVPRSCLNVVAGGRSIAFGSIRLTTKIRGKRMDQHQHDQQQQEATIHPRTRFILVIEKEATMEYLLSLGFCETHGPCILLTSKGYPDRAVRQLLNDSTSSANQSFGHSLDIPLLALVDCDPYGIEIYLTYRCGSVRSAYDNANLAAETETEIECEHEHECQWSAFERYLIPLTHWDRLKLVKLLTQHPYILRHDGWKKQISRMLMMNRKAELQSL
ncbi:Spo11/DNA topoisomerase VI subunit A, partial [Lobosporangium transversale]